MFFGSGIVAIDNHLEVIGRLYVEARAILFHCEAIVEFRQIDSGILLVAHLCQFATFYLLTSHHACPLLRPKLLFFDNYFLIIIIKVLSLQQNIQDYD
jgi:hypothetical protein